MSDQNAVCQPSAAPTLLIHIRAIQADMDNMHAQMYQARNSTTDDRLIERGTAAYQAIGAALADIAQGIRSGAYTIEACERAVEEIKQGLAIMPSPMGNRLQ